MLRRRWCVAWGIINCLCKWCTHTIFAAVSDSVEIRVAGVLMRLPVASSFLDELVSRRDAELRPPCLGQQCSWTGLSAEDTFGSSVLPYIMEADSCLLLPWPACRREFKLHVSVSAPSALQNQWPCHKELTQPIALSSPPMPTPRHRGVSS